MPSEDKRDRAAQYLDVMELQFVAQVADTQLAGDGAKDATIVDSSAIRSPPGTYIQLSVYYVYSTYLHLLSQSTNSIVLSYAPFIDSRTITCY